MLKFNIIFQTSSVVSNDNVLDIPKNSAEAQKSVPNAARAMSKISAPSHPDV